jgi:hypothetical protein
VSDSAMKLSSTRVSTPINLPLGHVIPFVEHAMHDTKAEVSEYS